MSIANLKIAQIKTHELEKCQNIWNINGDPKRKNDFYNELMNGNRITFVCKNENGDFLGEGSLVFNCEYENFTIPNKRVYLSHLHVKPEYRGQGVGTLLCDHIFNYCKNNGYSEISLAVLFSNYRAMKLYHRLGFTTILDLFECDDGRNLGMLKKLQQQTKTIKHATD